MAINFKYVIEGQILIIESHGFDEDFESTAMYGDAILKLVIDNSIKKVLCDERELEYNLSIPETFELVKRLVANAPVGIRYAIVSQSENKEAGNFFASAAGNRGAEINFFTDMESAKIWLKI